MILERFAALLGPRTKFVSVTHAANALGTIVSVEQIIALAHAWGVPVLVDTAQSFPHISSTSIFGAFRPQIFRQTGIGILYGKAHHLEAMPPWQGGGHNAQAIG